MRISDWSSDVCSSDLMGQPLPEPRWPAPLQLAAMQAHADFAIMVCLAHFRVQRIGCLDLRATGFGTHRHVAHRLAVLQHWRDVGTDPVMIAVLATILDQIGRASCRERVCQYV